MLRCHMDTLTDLSPAENMLRPVRAGQSEHTVLIGKGALTRQVLKWNV